MYLRALCLFSALCISISATRTLKFEGPDYESLPLDTIFPGPWESNIRAPYNKSHIEPVKIFKSEGAVSGAESVLQDAVSKDTPWVVRLGDLVTFEFAENIGGK
jgi:hypothetical protein